MKVTFVPVHTVFPGVAEMLTDGAEEDETLIVIAFETAFDEVAQAAFEVSSQVTISPSLSEVLVKVLLLVPLATPFTSH